MQASESQIAELAADVARRIGEVAAGRQQLVVYIEQVGTGPTASRVHTALATLLARDPRIVMSHLASGVSEPASPSPGGGYSEAIGLEVPTPPPDVTVQLVTGAAGLEVHGVLHRAPDTIERVFQLDLRD
jgi:hypothetical protein